MADVLAAQGILWYTWGLALSTPSPSVPQPCLRCGRSPLRSATPCRRRDQRPVGSVV